MFQPHTYSRTKALFTEFSKSLKLSDVVSIMDIYSSARETDTLGVDSKLLTKEVGKHQKDVSYTGGHKETLKFLVKTAQPGDIILTMGAGDIFYIHKDLLKAL